jgi:hypothetical protein
MSAQYSAVPTQRRRIRRRRRSLRIAILTTRMNVTIKKTK